MRFCEQNKIIPILEPQDHQAGVSGDSFSMENYGHFTLILSFGELTGDAILTVASGADAGTATTAETFNYRVTASELKTATGDNLGTESTSAALTLTAASYEDFMLVVEMDADELTTGQQWVTPAISSAGSEVLVSIVAILSEPRYAQAVPPTAIT